jgi:hypothetical protein
MKKLLLGAVMCLCAQHCYASQDAKLGSYGVMQTRDTLQKANQKADQKLAEIRKLPVYAAERKRIEAQIDNNPIMRCLVDAIANYIGNRLLANEYRSLYNFISELMDDMRYWLREGDEWAEKWFRDGKLDTETVANKLNSYGENKQELKVIQECLDNMLNIKREAYPMWDSLTREEEIHICACLDALLFGVFGIQPTDNIFDVSKVYFLALGKGYKTLEEGYEMFVKNYELWGNYPNFHKTLEWKEEIMRKFVETGFFERVVPSSNES